MRCTPSCGGLLLTLYSVARRNRVIAVVMCSYFMPISLRPLIAFTSLIALSGCTEAPDGSDWRSLPNPNVVCSERVTYPLVAQSVFGHVPDINHIASAQQYAFDFSVKDTKLVEIVQSSLSELKLSFCSVSDVVMKNGENQHQFSGKAVCICSIRLLPRGVNTPNNSPNYTEMLYEVVFQTRTDKVIKFHVFCCWIIVRNFSL